MPSLATFNANNFFLRYKFSKTFPGDMSKKSLIEGAGSEAIGYLPQKAFQNSKKYIIWDPEKRRLSAAALEEPDGKLPDILCLQEVENLDLLRVFNRDYLSGYYPYSLLIDGHDTRNIDVGVLSRFPIEQIRSHIDDKKGNDWIFSRDCLEVAFHLPEGETLYIFLNHLKSKLVMKKKNQSEEDYHDEIRKSQEKRRLQAETVVRLVEERFAGMHDTALYAVVGDFNDTPYSPYLKPLLSSARLTNIIKEYGGDNDSWTYYWRDRNRVSQIDFILASRALAERIRNTAYVDPKKRPHIIRCGLSYKEGASGNILPPKLVHFEEDDVTSAPVGEVPEGMKVPFDFPRYEEINDDWKKYISDHCPVKVWF